MSCVSFPSICTPWKTFTHRKKDKKEERKKGRKREGGKERRRRGGEREKEGGREEGGREDRWVNKIKDYCMCANVCTQSHAWD